LLPLRHSSGKVKLLLWEHDVVQTADSHVVEADGSACLLSLCLVEVEERSVLPDEGVRDHEGVLEALNLGEEGSVRVLTFTLRLKGGDGLVSRVLGSSRRRGEVGGEEAWLVDVDSLCRWSCWLVRSCWLRLVPKINLRVGVEFEALSEASIIFEAI
jgi:hypothetical protein